MKRQERDEIKMLDRLTRYMRYAIDGNANQTPGFIIVDSFNVQSGNQIEILDEFFVGVDMNGANVPTLTILLWVYQSKPSDSDILDGTIQPIFKQAFPIGFGSTAYPGGHVSVSKWSQNPMAYAKQGQTLMLGLSWSDQTDSPPTPITISFRRRTLEIVS